MRIGLIPQGPLERLAARLNLLPVPVIDTQLAFTLARVVMVATKLGVFDVLATGSATAATIADRCRTDRVATSKLLLSLVGSGYLRASGDRYELTKMARKWLVSDSRYSLVDKMIFQFDEWDLVEQSEQYLRTGEPVEIHAKMTDEEWRIYQRGMRAVATAGAPVIAKRVPVPAGASDLLDIGGSHGAYSVALCRRHPNLRAVVLDLPEAVAHAAPLLAAQGMGDRVVHRAADALTEDLGSETYDVVIIIGVVHHFTGAENRALAAKVAGALRPGGIFTIGDWFRPDDPRRAKQLPALMDFYFGLTSRSGTWPPAEMADWQRQAGLAPSKPFQLRAAGGIGIQSAVKPG